MRNTQHSLRTNSGKARPTGLIFSCNWSESDLTVDDDFRFEWGGFVKSFRPSFPLSCAPLYVIFIIIEIRSRSLLNPQSSQSFAVKEEVSSMGRASDCKTKPLKWKGGHVRLKSGFVNGTGQLFWSSCRRQAAGSSAGFCCTLITEINLITATRRRIGEGVKSQATTTI